MKTITFDPNLLKNLASKTAIVTGAANGIGAETSRLLNSHGANVVIADLESTRSIAEALIASLPYPSNAMFIPASIIDWSQMKALFKKTIERFGRVELVVANAGVMESSPVLDLDRVDEKGELVEAVEGFRVIDINMKGTLNSQSCSPLRALLLALSFAMFLFGTLAMRQVMLPISFPNINPSI